MPLDNPPQKECAACGRPVAGSRFTMLATPADGLLSRFLYVSNRLCAHCGRRAKGTKNGYAAVVAAIEARSEAETFH